MELFFSLFLVCKITWVKSFVKLCVISIHVDKYAKPSDDDTCRGNVYLP